jgi:hypothetical protein
MSNRWEPHGLPGDYAHENPDFDEQPERAPEGMVGRPEPILKLDVEIVFLTSRLLHFGHLTVSVTPEDVVSTSKWFLQSLHTYSYIGIVHTPRYYIGLGWDSFCTKLSFGTGTRSEDQFLRINI